MARLGTTQILFYTIGYKAEISILKATIENSFWATFNVFLVFVGPKKPDHTDRGTLSCTAYLYIFFIPPIGAACKISV